MFNNIDVKNIAIFREKNCANQKNTLYLHSQNQNMRK